MLPPGGLHNYNNKNNKDEIDSVGGNHSENGHQDQDLRDGGIPDLIDLEKGNGSEKKNSN